MTAQSVLAADEDKIIDYVIVTGSQVMLPSDYAGGQVARGGRVGLFGNLDIMDTPFSSTNYTAEFMRNLQARSIADVVQSDPGVRVARGFGNFQELYVPKRAPDRALNRVTVGAESGVEGYGALDFARRFNDGDFGVRANAVRRDGETSVDDQERQLTMFSLGMDYRGSLYAQMG